MAKAKTKTKKRNPSDTWVEGTSFGPKLLDRPDNWWHWDDFDGSYELGVTVLFGRSKRDEEGNRLDEQKPEALVEVAGPYGAITTQTSDWKDIDDLDERAKRFGAAFRSLPEEYQHALDRSKNLHPLWAAAQQAERKQPKAVDDVVLAILENPNGRVSPSNRARAKRLQNPRNY
jgi:hypothetical protein